MSLCHPSSAIDSLLNSSLVPCGIDSGTVSSEEISSTSTIVRKLLISRALIALS